MREDLVGYLIDALEPAERSAVEAQLSRDPNLKRDLETLRRSLSLLDCDRDHVEPPSGLAERTCLFVTTQVNTALAPPAAPAPSGRWRMADFVVAAGIFLAASLLFFPAIYQSRYAARLAGCQNNLRELGVALTKYSNAHGGYFPDLAPQGRHSTAGVYAAKLLKDGYLENPQWLICPASNLADDAHRFRVPTLTELEVASEDELLKLQRSMGGSYGYNLGYVADEKYQPTKNLGRKSFAIMADAPTGDVAHPQSLNHGTGGQNVLFEDGHVQHLTTCNAEGCRDNIYLNDKGQMAAGIHRDDAVIGPSPARPILMPLEHQDQR